MTAASIQPHPLIVLFVARKRVRFSPALLFQIAGDVLPGGFGGVISPHPAHLLNPGQMMSFPAVPHPIRRLSGKFIQPMMHFGIRLPKPLLRFHTMLFQRWHSLAPLRIGDMQPDPGNLGGGDDEPSGQTQADDDPADTETI